MSKLEELKDAMEAGKKRALKYRDECHDFVAGFVNRFRESIDCLVVDWFCPASRMTRTDTNHCSRP